MSDLQNQILDILKDGNFHSGGSLGEQLGVSRTAIWKQLQKLEDMGLPVESVKGTGYRVANGLELLAKTSIVKHLCNAKAQIPRRIEILKSVDSTNKYLHEQTDADYSKTVVFAERQTSGRGRRGKAWVSPFAANIYMSILWDFEQGAQALEGLSLGVGVAVRRALVELGIGNVGLKWPNDIYIGDKKLGGILLEMIGDPAGQCSVIVGVGINVAMPSNVDIDQPWTDLNSESAMPVSRNKLAANLTDHIFQLLDSFEVIGFGHYRDEWQDADAFKGRQGTIQTPRDAISGTIVGVDNRGAVQLRLPNGEVQSFIGGELSLRLAK